MVNEILLSSILITLMLIYCINYTQAQPLQGPPERFGIPDDVKVLSDIEYTRIGEKSLLLDLYLPEKAEGELPVIVWIHGGAFRMGSKESPEAAFMVSKGYAVSSINYRLSQEAIFPAQIEDCKSAIRWLRANAKQYGLDPNNIGVWGASAGGHLSAMLGTTGDVKELEGTTGNLEYSSRVQAVCDFFGPTDFLKMDSAGSSMNHDAPDSPESQLIAWLSCKNEGQKLNSVIYSALWLKNLT